jgi:hypothetical protein
MGIKDELEAELKFGAERCKVGRFLDTLDPKDAEEIQAALVSKNYPLEAVRRVMIKRGFDGGITICHRHAKKDCCCVN